MSDTGQLRAAVVGLVALAAAEEEVLLATARVLVEEGSAENWAALPLIAHNTEFKGQQLQRLQAVRRGEDPPSFAEIDHRSTALYTRYASETPESVGEASRNTTRALLEEVRAVSDDDLLDPSRHAFLAGRHLWLQVVVRGFWHPAGHLGDYYLAHGLKSEALSLQERAVAFAAHLCAPDPARAMALYNLACIQARVGLPACATTLAEALDANPDLRANARRDPDLEALRADGSLAALLGPE
jgi:hypothetical protein